MIRAFTHTPPSRGKITGFAVLISSRRSSINVVFVVVWHGSLVIVTVVVYVVVRLGSWPIVCSGPERERERGGARGEDDSSADRRENRAT